MGCGAQCMYGLVVTHSYIQREIIYFALVSFITCISCSWKIAEDANNSGHILNAQRLSFSQNLCTGNVSEEENTAGEIPEKVNGDEGSRTRKQRSGDCGGYTC